MEQKQYLNNAAIIRVILIVLLVFYHAFLVYSGGWESSGSFPIIEPYWWLDRLSFAFMLEAFVFVSGYVFGFQVRTKGEKKLEAKSLFLSKFNRLMIPSIIFSLLYILIFGDITHHVVTTCREVIEGAGHMWFLPMLLWCFLGIWLIEKMKLKAKIVLPLLILCSICSFLPLPLQLNAAMYYMLFFYVGYILQRNNASLEKYYMPKYVIALSIGFFIVFPALTIFRQNIGDILANRGGYLVENQLIGAAIKHSFSNIAKLVYSSIGLAALFVLVGVIEKNRTSQFPHWIIKVGALCMGVYLFQQFILMAIYKFTTLPTVVGPYAMPWLAFVIALFGSLLLSYVLRLTKVGRFLIG